MSAASPAAEETPDALFDPMAEMAAAEALVREPGRTPESLLEAAAKMKEPQARAVVYRAIGALRKCHSGEALSPSLPAMREAAKKETDDDAARWGRAACARLGGRDEWDRILKTTSEAVAQTAKRCAEELSYMEDVHLTRGLVSWLRREDAVDRLTTDADPRCLRICDLAVILASSLGVSFDVPPGWDVNYDHATRDAAIAAIEALPAPAG